MAQLPAETAKEVVRMVDARAAVVGGVIAFVVYVVTLFATTATAFVAAGVIASCHCYLLLLLLLSTHCR